MPFISPSQDLKDFVDIEVTVLKEQGLAPDIYWHQHDAAVLVTDRLIVEIGPNPDGDEGEEKYVADYLKVERP
jgi:hypothetical protein